MKYDLVEVVWTDAVGSRDSEWERFDELLSDSDEKLPRVHSLGYLIKRTDEYVLIVSNLVFEKERVEYFQNYFKIPTGMIVSFKTLKRKK